MYSFVYEKNLVTIDNAVQATKYCTNTTDSLLLEGNLFTLQKYMKGPLDKEMDSRYIEQLFGGKKLRNGKIFTLNITCHAQLHEITESNSASSSVRS